MGQISNSPPELTLQTDEIVGELPTVYSANNITETGTIWLNTTVSDPDQDNVNCSYYLLNDDYSLNKTILSLFELNNSFGTCYYEWDLTNEIEGDYYIQVNVTDGVFISSDILNSIMRIDNTLYENTHNITINSPKTDRNLDHTVFLNITLSGYADLNYSIDTDPEVSGCTLCTSFITELDRLSDGFHDIYFYTYNETVLTNVTMITIELYTASGGAEGSGTTPTTDDTIIELPLETVTEIYVYEETKQIDLTVTNPNDYTVFLNTDTGIYRFKPNETIIIPFNLNYTKGEYNESLSPLNAPLTNITINVLKKVELNMDLITNPTELYNYLTIKFTEPYTFPNGDTAIKGVLFIVLSLIISLGIRLILIFNKNTYLDGIIYLIVSSVILIILLLI